MVGKEGGTSAEDKRGPGKTRDIDVGGDKVYPKKVPRGRKTNGY